MPGQGKYLGKAMAIIYVLSLEIKGGNVAGGTRTITAVLLVRDAHAGAQTL